MEYNKHLERINKILLFRLMIIMIIIINEKTDNDATKAILNSYIMGTCIKNHDQCFIVTFLLAIVLIKIMIYFLVFNNLSFFSYFRQYHMTFCARLYGRYI